MYAVSHAGQAGRQAPDPSRWSFLIMRRSLSGVLTILLAVVSAAGCAELRGRRKIQEGNRLYRDGAYKEAVATFEAAEKLVPNLWLLWLNKGYTCRQMIIPGAKSAESREASQCAQDAFRRMQELKPDDARGELLYIQTLFDSDAYETLSKVYLDKHRANPKDQDAITGLIQVYSKWGKLDEALAWWAKQAELQEDDAETQYAVGVYIWQQLFQKGGGPDKSLFDPRPSPDQPTQARVPPGAAYGDIVGQRRVDLADQGIEYLKRAIALRPQYGEAMAYVNLLWRQRSFAFFDQPEEWQKAVDQAEEWRQQALLVMGKAPPPPAVAPAKPDQGARQSRRGR